MGGSGGVDVRGDRSGTDEAECLDARVGQEGVDRFLAAVDDVEHAGRQAGLQKEFGEPQRDRGVSLGRLEDEGVAAGQRGGRLPQRDHGGEVEGRDARDDAERGAQRVHVDPAAGVVGELALEEVRDSGREFDDLQAALDVAVCVGDGLAVLGRQKPGQGVPLLLHERQEPQQDPRPPLRVPVGPVALGTGGVRDRGLGLGSARQGDAGLDLSGVGVVHVAVGTRGSLGVPAADEVGQVAYRGVVLRADHECLLSSGDPGRRADMTARRRGGVRAREGRARARMARWPSSDAGRDGRIRGLARPVGQDRRDRGNTPVPCVSAPSSWTTRNIPRPVS